MYMRRMVVFCFGLCLILPSLGAFWACETPTSQEEVSKEPTVWRPDGGEVLLPEEGLIEEPSETQPERPAATFPYRFERVEIERGVPLYTALGGEGYKLIFGGSVFYTDDDVVWLNLAPSVQEGVFHRAARRGERILAVTGTTQEPFLGQVLLSGDGGKTWRSVLSVKQEGRDNRLRDAMWITETIALVVGHSGLIFRTQDGGETWREIEPDAAMRDVHLEGMARVGNEIFAVGSQGGIFLTENNGADWQVLNKDPRVGDLRDVSFFKDRIAIAVGTQGAAFRTEDVGRTWQRFNLPPAANEENFRALQSDGENRMAVIGRKSIWLSTNRGASWGTPYTLPTNLLPVREELTGVFFFTRERLYILTSDGYLLNGTLQP